jgi:hypothetical protein
VQRTDVRERTAAACRRLAHEPAVRCQYLGICGCTGQRIFAERNWRLNRMEPGRECSLKSNSISRLKGKR